MQVYSEWSDDQTWSFLRSYQHFELLNSYGGSHARIPESNMDKREKWLIDYKASRHEVQCKKKHHETGATQLLLVFHSNFESESEAMEAAVEFVEFYDDFFGMGL